MEFSAPPKRGSGRLFGLVAAALFIALSFLWIEATLTYGSQWIRLSAFYGGSSIIGYSESELGALIHKENRSFLQQIALFAGATSDVVDKFYFLRPFYAFLAAFLAPILGIKSAAWALNWLGWAVCAACAWGLSIRLFADRLAALIAVILVACGLGFVIHLADISAHLMSFATYYLGIYLFYRSEIWRGPPKRLGIHVAIGAYLGIAFLTYNTGLSLIVAYAILAFRHNRLFHVALAAAIGICAQYLWLLQLNIGYALTSGHWAWYDLRGTEQHILANSTQNWLAAWSNPLTGIAEVGRLLSELLSFDSPVTILAGIAGLILMLWRDPRRGWFFLVLAAMPIAASLVFVEKATARGYLVYGISLIAYVLASGLAVSWIRRAALWPKIGGISLIVLMIGSQAYLIIVSFAGEMAPALAFFFGADHVLSWFAHPTLTALSLTGREASPIWFGGSADFSQLGLYQGAGPVESHIGFVKRVLLSLASRSLFSLYFIAAIALLVFIRRNQNRLRLAVTCGLGFLILYLVPSLVMAASVHRVDRFVAVDLAGPATDCRSLHYNVRLSAAFREQLAHSDVPDAKLNLFFRPAGDTTDPPAVKFGEHVMTLHRGASPGIWSIDDPDWREALRQADSIDLVYRSADAIRYLGWQRAGLPDRTLSFADCADPAAANSSENYALPALELRVRAGTAIVLVGY